MQWGKVGRSLLIASLIVVWFRPGLLWAHDPALARSDPLDGESVCPGDVQKVTAWFNGELDVIQSGISISGPSGLLVQIPSREAEKDLYAGSEDTGEPEAAIETAVDLYNPGHNSLVASLKPPLDPGIYSVSWKAVDTVDKLVKEGSFSFTLREEGCGAAIPLWGFVGLGVLGVAVLLGAGKAVQRRR